MVSDNVCMCSRAEKEWGNDKEFHFFFAVLAERLKFAAVGAPLDPGFLIFSPLPAAILFFLAWMLAYKPRLAGMINTSNVVGLEPS